MTDKTKSIKSKENRHVVELIGREGDEPTIITPYVKVNITGAVAGSGEVDKYGEVNITDTSLSGSVVVTGIVQGEGSMDKSGNINITTHVEDWQMSVGHEGKVLNFFRSK